MSAALGSRRGAQAARQFRQLERVPAEHVDVVPHERGEPGDVLVADVEVVGPALGDGGILYRVLKRARAVDIGGIGRVPACSAP